MISTLEIKIQQLTNGAFRVGSGNEVMLIMGSCRAVPYLNYLNEWNKSHNKYTIYFIDPFNFNWNIKEERVDYMEQLERLEMNDVMLTILSSVDVFIHEYYKSFGMFNTDDNGEKNIYDFGMNPKTDVCIPNFNDFFILFNDVISFDNTLKEKAKLDYLISGNLSEETEKEIFSVSQRNLDKFFSNCKLSDMPEMESYFRDNMKSTRFHWTSNHISKHFSLVIFKFLNERFLKLDLSEQFLDEISKEDMYANNYTHLTQYDLKYYGYVWDEQIIDLKLN